MTPSADHLWHWTAALPLRRPALCDWLRDPGSLTERLRRHCRQFRVAVLAREARLSLTPAQRALLDAEQAYCREVLLLCDGRPWVYASSLYSPTTRAAIPELAELGQRALGELLFDAPDLRRSTFEYAELAQADYDPLAVRLGLAEPAAGPLWGRRSTLATGRARVLVTELFLPAVPAYLEPVA
ncbi:chorismate--pyruvate lyase family protein [Zobellella sp. DQSA1]|uniref:chorismate--pyruvate lyase family protein n=1 Tax=Zobellella sp. DQSA1 TaxID=3342386 RepID=UPI0035C20BF5